MLSNFLDSDRNSFNLVRLVAALAVIISHSFSLQTGLGSSEPLASLTPFTLGQHAVNIFFVISGLTLSNSLQRNPDVIQYLWARLLRIFPPLFAFGLIFSFVAGPWLTSMRLTEYLADSHTWTYPASVLANFSRAAPPPGIFSNGPYAGVVNEPLWTIKYELVAYLGLALFFCLGFSNRIIPSLLALAVALGIFVFAAPSPDPQLGASSLYQFGRYGFCFLLGVIAYQLRDWLSVNPLLLILPASFVLLISDARLAGAGYILLVGHMALVAGARSYGALTLLTRRTDLSYGTYIYGWPIQQSLIALTPGITVASLLLCSLAIVPIVAVGSWYLVEKPALCAFRGIVSTDFTAS